MKLVWSRLAINDREAIMDFIARDNPQAAIALDDHFEAFARRASEHLLMHKPGRLDNTREVVIRRHYVMIYQICHRRVRILRVLHSAQHWP
ncbi:type II toxin-antitoxin system RelE/ParE family toxin [Enterobacteriaceae bacterium BIT-l23]|uniref:type II toxin-antitoxin system RelE/ParE family toxin n=1 Tax=Jejubacter sp. L23 TaxID=3092086 RepID=UPI001584B353|nr:type II toxin-antitoxin system RelE/ParE family toxin [Enterobacteriaceae bacterium BIT-l23]